MLRPIDREYRRRLIQKRVPLFGSFELTNRCNLNCKHCCVRVGGKEFVKKELNLKQVCSIIEQLAHAQVVSLGLTGGEPLIRPDFKEIYVFAKKKGLAVSVSTNATLIKADIINLFESYPPVAIEITTYGTTAKTYEGITRIKGSFQLYQNAINELKKTRLRFSIRFMTMRDNYHQAKEAEDIARASNISFTVSYYLFPRRDRNEAKNKIIRAQRLSPEETIQLLKSLKLPLRLLSAHHPHNSFIEACGMASIGFAINPYGRLYSCGFIDKPNIDLTKINFTKAWILAKTKRVPLAQKRRACGECQLKAKCPWCPGAAYLETGDAEKKVTYLCRVMKRLAQG